MTDRELALHILTLAIDPRLNEMHENAAIEEISRDEITLIAMTCAERGLRDLTAAGLAIIDTRTHAAVPREPSEADVSRIASVLFMCGPDMTFHDQARAAIAALVAAQTQGGEREDV